MLIAALELRTRERPDRTVLAGIALSGMGVATFALALGSLWRRGQSVNDDHRG